MTTKASEKAMRIIWRGRVMWHSPACIRGPDEECRCDFNQRAFDLGLAIDALVREEVEAARVEERVKAAGRVQRARADHLDAELNDDLRYSAGYCDGLDAAVRAITSVRSSTGKEPQ